MHSNYYHFDPPEIILGKNFISLAGLLILNIFMPVIIIILMFKGFIELFDLMYFFAGIFTCILISCFIYIYKVKSLIKRYTGKIYLNLCLYAGEHSSDFFFFRIENLSSFLDTGCKFELPGSRMLPRDLEKFFRVIECSFPFSGCSSSMSKYQDFEGNVLVIFNGNGSFPGIPEENNGVVFLKDYPVASRVIDATAIDMGIVKAVEKESGKEIKCHLLHCLDISLPPSSDEELLKVAGLMDYEKHDENENIQG